MRGREINYLLIPLEQGSWEEEGPKQGRPPLVGGGLLQDLKRKLLFTPGCLVE